MSIRPKNSISKNLNASKVAITNTKGDAEIQAAVAGFGYHPVKMDEGLALYSSAEASVSAQVAAAGAQRTASAEMLKTWKIANTAYQDLAKVSRAIFIKKPAFLTTLGVSGTQPRSTDGFITAASTLFDNALSTSEIQTALEVKGYTIAKLQSEKAKITAYDTANDAQESAKGAAQQATKEQDDALSALNAWMAEYKKIAKVALSKKKQLLEKLGITARTTKTKAQRQAPKKAAATRAAKKIIK